MSRGIPLSPKHGLNPTIPICFWCGKKKNEIALLGKMKEDAEAPRHCVLDYEPCDECKKNFALGVVAIEVRTSPYTPGQPPIQQGAYPTGRLVVLTTEAADRMFDKYAPWKKGAKVLLESPVFQHIMPPDSPSDTE